MAIGAHEVRKAERGHVIDDCLARSHHQGHDGLHNARVVAPCRPRPFLSDGSRTKIGIPRQAAKPVQIGHRQRMPDPIHVCADVCNAYKSPRRTTERLAGSKVFDKRAIPVQVHIEIEHLFPHRWEKT